jgi:hypothetical protein
LSLVRVRRCPKTSTSTECRASQNIYSCSLTVTPPSPRCK